MAQCNQPVFKRLPWRSDTIDDKECGPEEQWEQRITNWLHSVEGRYAILLFTLSPHFFDSLYVYNSRHSLPSASSLPSLRPSLSVGAMTSRRPARAPSRAVSEPVHGHHIRSWSADSSDDVPPRERARLLLRQSFQFSAGGDSPTGTTTTDSVPPRDDDRGRSQ